MKVHKIGLHHSASYERLQAREWRRRIPAAHLLRERQASCGWRRLNFSLVRSLNKASYDAVQSGSSHWNTPNDSADMGGECIVQIEL